MDTSLDSSVDYWLKRYQRLEADRLSYWDDNFQNLADYILPRKSNILTRREKGADLNGYVFDSAPIHANELLASRMQADLVPSSSNWFYLDAEFSDQDRQAYDEDLNKNTEVKKFFDDCVGKMKGQIDASNFDVTIHEFLLDLGCFGTACMSMEGVPDANGSFKRFRFQSIPIQHYVFCENSDGEVDTVMRKLKKTARQAFQKWPDAEFHETIRESLKKDPEKEFTFIHIVFPKEDFDPHTKKTKKNMPFGSVVIDETNKQMVEEAGYVEFPFFVARWAKCSGEKYGRGPGRTAIHDINVLNASKLLEMRAWSKVIDPPLMAEHDTFMGNIRIVPNSVIHVRDITRPPIPFISQTRWDISALKRDELVQSIKRIFYSDQLQMPEQEQNKMTAREVMVRYQLMQSLMGSTFGRIVTELLSPLVTRLYSKMERAKMIPEMPAMLANVEGLNIKYKSPLAMAQRYEEVQSINAWLESVLPLAQADPTVLDVVDLKQVALCQADLMGVPAKVLRDEKEVMQIEQNRQMTQIQQMKAEQMQQQTEGLRNVAPFMREAGQIQGELAGEIG